MRFGKWRGVAFALALSVTFAIGQARPARAEGLFHTIPREVEAVDIHTGGPYMAPPVPYGHYAKDCGHIAGAAGCLASPFCMLKGKLGGLCGACKGAGCDQCGGGHGLGLGLFHRGCGGGDPCGGGAGCGGGHGGGACGACGGAGCGFCQGMGLLHNLGGDGCGGGACGRGLGHGHGLGLGSGHGHDGCAGTASIGCPIVQPSSQAVFASGQCGDPGCQLRARHFHRRGRGCSGCNGIGCGICQQGSGLLSGNLCGSCRGGGCGLCGGRGLFGGGDPGRACGACGGAGCDQCGGHGGKGCGACGGRGCRLCLGGGGLLKASHSILGMPHALVAKALHKGEIKYFVGPGGPVPITPGYVPYIVTTRSPRDYFAFPPFVDVLP